MKGSISFINRSIACDEPPGGAHTDPDLAAKLLDDALQHHFSDVQKIPARELVDTRYHKFRKMAQFYTEG